MDLAGLRSPQLAGVSPVLAVPLGATEQHGPHLPLGTDTAIAVELCRRLAERLPRVLVAPAVPYGSSGEHAAFPGTLSIGRAAVELLVVELVRSADAFAGVVLVSGHGGNLEPLGAAVGLLRSEGRRVLAWLPDGPPTDSHAGRTETSVMLRLAPGGVALGDAEPGDSTPLPRLLHRLRHGGLAAVSPNGVLGDPTGADASEGERILQRWADSLTARVRAWLAAW
ncbi:MAG TPA: mycofactocin biosynthesis peptidyl-dipeptidase MftE [Pseudonocardiaceae bacterium]